MMSRFLPLLPLLAFTLSAPLTAQEPDRSDMKKELQDLPDWLLEFSNVEPKDKAVYIQEFKAAKTAYILSNWVDCELHLNNCEMIFKGNPSIWNLRCSALIEQGRVEEAEEELTRARQALPNDDVTLMNIANLYLAKKEYAASIEHISSILDKIPYVQTGLRDTLTYRLVLCHLMLGQKEEAQELVKDASPMSDTPLYYFCKASFAIADGDRKAAMQAIGSCNRIFSKTAASIPYQRALNISGLIEKYLPAEGS